jgi:hypothetical protein
VTRHDLDQLERLYQQAAAVVATEDVHDGLTHPMAIAVRHDVDNVIQPAVEMARWEHERGYRSTYFILHGNGVPGHYWFDKTLLRESLETIAGYGHEIGLHVNALAESLRTGRDPVEIIEDTVVELRSYGHRIRGVVAHGDPLCHRARFVNDEIFVESARPSYGPPGRIIEADGARVQIRPVSRRRFGLEYDPNWLPRADYLSDSGGTWSQPLDEVATRFPHATGQLHLLVHADWWIPALGLTGAVR